MTATRGIPKQVAAANAERSFVVTANDIQILQGAKQKFTLEVKFNPHCVALSPTEKELAVGGSVCFSVFMVRP